MTQSVAWGLADDLDGSPADRTVRFGWQGVQYEIDLSTEHLADLEATIGRYLAAARPVTPRKLPARAKRESGRAAYLRRVRAWAREHGYPVFDRGKIPHAIIEAYEQGS
jgi:hypothetical protein